MIKTVLLFLTFMLSFGLTFWVRQFALHKNIIDTPNERSSHTIPTPRGGGLAIVVSFYITLLLFYWLLGFEPSILYGLLGLASIALIGFIDDHNHIPAHYRLLVHFAASAWACYWFGVIPWTDGPSVIMWGISLFCLVWLLNLYNFMDGIDGIASVETITVLASAALVLMVNGSSDHANLMLIPVAAVFGFLFWNWPPAKIFMGDVGSAFIGILIGALSLFTANDGSLGLPIWLIILAVFITDASYTLVVRLLRGEKVYQAHRSHAYQHLARQYGHKSVTLGVLLVNLFWLLPLALLAHYYSQFTEIYLMLAYLPLILLAMKSRAGLPETP